MANILLVDDDDDQLELRSLILKEAGHKVRTATSPEDARRSFDTEAPDTVVMDLRLPAAEDGLSLIRHMRGGAGNPRIYVVSGWPADLNNRPESAMVDRVLEKPVKSEVLLGLLKLVLCCVLAPPLLAATHGFSLEHPAEVVAEIQFRESGLAALLVDAKPAGHVQVLDVRQRYGVMLGELSAGAHELRTPGEAAVTIRSFAKDDPHYEVIANAPYLYARPNTVGTLSDVPLLVYCERLGEQLQYTAIFSNEDGGTSTRALMARWGRTTDIEHVYRYWPASGRAEIQTKGHADVLFQGRREGRHPLLYVSTDNNMVAGQGESPVRYQLAPILVDLSGSSREKVMDDHPFTYRLAAEELAREGKLRPFRTVDGQKISDPRNYLYLEAHVGSSGARIAARVRLQREGRWRTSHLGRVDYAIERGGWVRTTVELPPGTRPTEIAEIGFDCLVEPAGRDKPAPIAGACVVKEVSRLFMLEADHVPGGNFWRLAASGNGWAIPTGETLTWSLAPGASSSPPQNPR